MRSKDELSGVGTFLIVRSVVESVFESYNASLSKVPCQIPYRRNRDTAEVLLDYDGTIPVESKNV